MLDYLIPYTGTAKADRPVANRSGRHGAASSAAGVSAAGGTADSGYAEHAGQDDQCLRALARSLSQEARQACADRVAMRTFPQLTDHSDPCVCGEALLFIMAAQASPGRAPVSAFEEFGEPR